MNNYSNTIACNTSPYNYSNVNPGNTLTDLQTWDAETIYQAGVTSLTPTTTFSFFQCPVNYEAPSGVSLMNLLPLANFVTFDVAPANGAKGAPVNCNNTENFSVEITGAPAAEVADIEGNC